jgi:AbrB family looped-hinge helix DNA binding protein
MQSGTLAWRELCMADILKVGRKGEVMLPRRVRAALGLQEGDELVVSVDDESIILKRKARRFAEYLEGLGRAPIGRDRS